MSADAFPLGATVRVVGERNARYTVKRTYDDGTVLLWGGTSLYEKYRQVAADRLRLAKPLTPAR